ncbi:hypothetical protein HQN87_11045 [Paenibacillus tritici]|uniref:Uncharacterized protein n=1 Tax=Paenibacillus tritici TaxID=1873425 RepID=A0ABX2DQI2_9BACL|nr:hypothetical protein [Paenibacillus tritici]NQX45869.1 hypothetical protein [Paenibacillus tritici]
MKYIIIGAGNELSRYTWFDVIDRNDVYYKEQMYELTGFKKILQKIHCSARINKIINLPFKNRWWKYNELRNIEFNKEFYLVLGDTAFGKSDISYLKMLRENYQVKVIIVLLNPINSISKDLKTEIDKMDRILTTDLQDSSDFNYPYISTVYSKIPIDLKLSNENNTDLFFVGAEKNRLSILLKCFEIFKKNNIMTLFYIFNVKNKHQKYKNEIFYNSYLKYSEILEKVGDTNCIFEVLQNSQTGITYRTMEAVCYNKKLLTNNKNIKKFAFYNPDYIEIFENPEDINIEFIKKRIVVDYGYNNEYSPVNILNYIAEIEVKE